MIDKKLKNKQKEVWNHIEERLAQYKQQKQHLDRLWFTSILFYRGEQWITYDTSLHQFRRTNQRRVIPRPVTNRFAPACNSIISNLSRFDPKIMIAPQTDTKEDLKTAQVANRVVKTVENEVKFDKKKAELLPWLVLTGNGFIINGFNADAGKKVPVVGIECPQCEYEDTREEDESPSDCPQCADEGLKVLLRDKVTETGELDVSVSPTGKLDAEVANPFQMFIDYRITDIQDQSTIIRILPKSVEWVKGKYPKQKETIAPSKRPELNTRMLHSLAGYFYGAPEPAQEECVDLVVAWHKPSSEFKEGYYAVYSGEGVFHELMPFPTKTKDGEEFYPITHFVFDRMPGSALGRTPAFDLIEKQKTRNRVEAIGEMILMRTSNPVWLKPVPGTSSTITGHIGQEIEYDPHQTDGHVPARVEAAQLPPAIVHWLDRIDRDIDVIAAQNEVTKGERPLSGKSGFFLAKLQEIANDRNTGLFTNYSIAVAEWQI